MTFTLANLNEEQIEFLKIMGEYDNFEHPYKTMYNLQSKFDKKVIDKHNLTYTDIEFGARNIFALFSEFGELLDEMSWPWWKKKEFSVEGALNELRDLQHFILKSIIHAGLDLEEVMEDLKFSDYTRGGWDAMNNDMGDERYTMIDFTTIEGKIEVLVTELAALLGGLAECPDDPGCLLDAQIVILRMQQVLGYSFEDAFKSYLDKNVENHARQNGKSKDQTRGNQYAKEGSVNTNQFIKNNDGSVTIKDATGKEIITLTDKTIFELSRL